MAFTKSLPITRKDQGSILIWTDATVTVASSGRQADSALVWFNPAGVGSIRAMGIIVEAVSSSGNSDFDLFWKGAHTFDAILDDVHDFWTAVATTSTISTFSYYYDGSNSPTSVGGTAAASPLMFNVPYISFGMRVGGAQEVIASWTIMCQLASSPRVST